MVDAHASGACEETHGGSSPFIGKFFCKIFFCDIIVLLKIEYMCRRGTLPEDFCKSGVEAFQSRASSLSGSVRCEEYFTRVKYDEQKNTELQIIREK